MEFTKQELFKMLNREKEYWERKFHIVGYDKCVQVHGRLIEIDRLKRLINNLGAYKYSCRYVPKNKGKFYV